MFVFLALYTKAQGSAQMFWALNKNSDYLLDVMSHRSASVAYSTRKLRAQYTGPAMRIRRSQSGTDPVGNVYFDSNGELSASSRVEIVTTGTGFTGSTYTLGTFISSASVYVTVWYDQSGNGRDLVQNTTARQPRLASSGTLETANSRASVRFITSNEYYLELSLSASSMFASGRTGTVSTVLDASSGTTSAFGYSDGGSDRWQAHMNESTEIRFDVGNSYNRITAVNNTYVGNLTAYALLANTSLMQIWRNASLLSSSTSSVSACGQSTFYLGAIPPFPGAYYHNDHISELVIFNVALSSAEINTLYTNQKAFFGL